MFSNKMQPLAKKGGGSLCLRGIDLVSVLSAGVCVPVSVST